MWGGRGNIIFGQASTELIMVLGVSLFAVMFFVFIASDSLLDVQAQQSMRDARDAANGLSAAADYVFAQGPGATTSVEIRLPQGTDFSPDRTFVGRPAGASAGEPSNAININVRGTDVSASSSVPIAGTLPGSPGTHIINVTSRGTFVSIGTGIADATPSSVFVSMRKNDYVLATVALNIRSSRNVVVNITSQWGHANVSLGVSPSNFYGADVSVPVSLVFQANSSTGGTYNSKLIVDAYEAGSPALRQSFSVPITLDVRDA